MLESPVIHDNFGKKIRLNKEHMQVPNGTGQGAPIEYM